MIDDYDIYDWLQIMSDEYGMERCSEAADTIWRLREALRALVIAVEYKGPPVDFGEGNLCWEARVPLAFVDNARAALGEGKE